MADQDFTHASFTAHLAEHRLRASRCQSCGAEYLPPRPLCPQCYSTDMDWVETPTEGVLTAYTIIHIAPTAMLQAGYGRDNPYCAGIVELENGLSISAHILGVDVSKPDSIRIGTPVKVEFIERGEGEARKTFLAFRIKR